jgi:hypothetical protein
MVAGYGTFCTIGGWYHGGINMCGSNANHLYDPTCGLNGSPPSGSPPSELSLGEFSSCPPFGG